MIVYSLWHLRKLAWRFLDQKEQDQANLKKRSRPNGLRSRHGQDTENAIVIDLMKTAVVWDGGFTPESQSHADSLSWIRRSLVLHIEMREISLRERHES
jgi:hypothetical protein